MNFVMCDTLRFVTQLSFHSFFIYTFKFVICVGDNHKGPLNN
jgi:hypothetical protein